MSILGIVGTVMLGIAVVFAAYAVTMYVYYLVRRWWTHRRYTAEISVIAAAAVLSFAVRLAALLCGGAVTFGGALGDTFHAIYMAIGGFTFEGLDGAGALPLWGEVLYYGVTVYAGLVALSVITARVSYEIFSAVGYAFTLAFRKRRDIFVFTAVTEDALLLADSIDRKYREKPDPGRKNVASLFGTAGQKGGIPFEKKRRCLIVFSGNELEPFDHKNELHRALMSRGYYYMSYGKRRKKEKEFPLTKKLHIAVVNDPAEKGKKTKNIFRRYHDARRHVFAVRVGKALTGEEASNSDFVFDDIRASLRRLPDDAFAAVWLNAAAVAERAVNGPSDVPVAEKPSDREQAERQQRELQDVYSRVETERKTFLSAFTQQAAAAARKALYTVVDYHILTDDEINYEFYATELDSILHDLFAERLRTAFAGLLRRAEQSRAAGKKDKYAAFADAAERLSLRYLEFAEAAAAAAAEEASARLDLAEFAVRDGEQAKVNAESTNAYYGTDETRRKLAEATDDLRVYEEEWRRAAEDVSSRADAQEKLAQMRSVPAQQRIEWFAGAVSCDGPMLGCIRRNFQLHIFNEAQLSARDFSIRRTAAYRREDGFEAQGRGLSSAAELPWTDSLLHRDVEVPEPSFDGGDGAEDRLVYRAVVLGFGKTAQCAMNALLVQTSAVDETGMPTQFIADVYDRAVDERCGLFAYTHPLYQCFKCEDCLPLDAKQLRDKALTLDDTAHQVLYDRYRDFVGPDDPGYERAPEIVNEQIGFPRICFHKTSSFDLNFMRMLDTDISGDGSSVKNAVRAFIICLGSDEANIRMANALIDDFKHEVYAGDSAVPTLQTVYVHIRDEKNRHRLNWTAEDEAFFRRCKRRLVVVRFGNREAMYSYDGLLEERPAEAFKRMYDRFSAGVGAREDRRPDWVLQMTELLQKTEEHPLDAVDFYRKSVWPTFREMLGIGSEELYGSWLDADAYLKQSNESVYLFADVYAGLLSQNGLTMSDLKRFVRLEKVRWNRFYMSNGWIFGEPDEPEQKKMRRRGKEHDGLCSFEMLGRAKDKKGTVYKLYDAANVLLGYFAGAGWAGKEPPETKKKRS